MNARGTLGHLSDLARSATDGVPSPCISVCRMDAGSSLCLGCFRTIEEIIAWGRQSDVERRQVWQRIARRAGLAPMTVSDKGLDL
jgi:predicted Fe-S protein YdhL (DUF1289 family)